MDADAQGPGLGGDGQQVGGRDQRLARHAVGEHCGAPGPIGIHDGHSGSQLRSHERGLIAPGPRAHNHD